MPEADPGSSQTLMREAGASQPGTGPAVLSVTWAVRPGRQVVQIDRPIDVLLLYLTASPTPDGRIQYHHDIYQRDPAALALLQNPHQAWFRAKRDSL